MDFLERPASACHGIPRAGIALLLICIAAHSSGAAYAVAATNPLASSRRAVDRLAAAGSWPPAEVRPVLDVLEKETRRLLSMPSDRTARQVGEVLLPILTKLHEGLSGRIDAMREEVFERDGDIEKLMATRAYRDRETLALTALYHLSWTRYQVSQLLPRGAPTREELLGSAVRGFTEFVYVNEIPEIYGDCLYGRALAFYALGEKRKATQDLEEVIALGRSGRAYARARSALEAVRRGQPIGPPALVDQTTAELEQLKKLLDSQGSPGKERTAPRHAEALALARTLAARGGRTAERVNTLVREAGPGDGAFPNFLLAELAADRGDHETARDHYGAAAAARDADAPLYRSRARVGVAAASYRAGDYARAVKEFANFLSENPEGDETEVALYFRFKAIEALGAEAVSQQAEGEADDEALVGALSAYLDRFPQGKHAAEVRYRLGEAFHTRGDCAAALAVIGNPKGLDAWSLWARFIVLQCQADAARASWRAGEPHAEVSYLASLQAAREISSAATGTNDATLARLAAKACLLGGLLAEASPTPRPDEVVEFTRDFEHRFPNAADLASDAIALRVVARARLGETDEARADIDRLSKLEGDVITRQQRLRQVGYELMGEVERGDPARRHAVLSVAERVFTTLLEPTLNGADTGGASAPTATDLAILGQIALSLGDLDRAQGAYGRLLEIDPDSLEARRGLALTAEAAGNVKDALGHWIGVTERTAPGETLWCEATIHAARMEERLGRPEQACVMLREATARAGLPTIEEMASAFDELLRRVCR